ncbi:MAG TPA: signal recognition particle-docking protein FtsY [Enterococcus aquimarinus]|nr:signal recognition particle-docking protein FtsY [Enterococcus aquimarinus]
MGLFDKLKRAFTKENGETPIEVEESAERTGQEDEDGLSDEAPVSTETATTSPDSELSSEEIESQMPPIETETMTELTKETVGQELAEEASQQEERLPEAVVVEEKLEVEATKASEPLIEEVTVQEKYDKGLAKTRKTFKERMNELFANFRSVDEDFFEEVEETLIGADVGFETSMKIADELRQEVKLRNVKKPAAVQNLIIEKLVDLYEAEGVGEVNALNLQPNGLTVMLFVGVNGVGKTTSIGKLAYEYKQAGKKVLLAAADTFRAGAIDQLVVWGERADVEVIRGKAGGDPAAVVFDAMVKAKEKQADILLVDTAGRLQNKAHLMQELDKIKRIIQREEPNAPHEVLLVLDATTGQNAMSQAKQFKETTDVTGLVLTKLDGTAKGGIVLAIRNELHLPVKLVGLGEGIEDLEIFNPNDFVIGLFKGLLEEE